MSPKNIARCIRIGNPHRKSRSIKVGAGEPLRILVNLGLSQRNKDAEVELQKFRVASKMGADVLADNTVVPQRTTEFRRLLLEKFKQPISTVPLYETCMNALVKHRHIGAFSDYELLETVEQQAKDGVDMMTIHASFTKALFRKLRSSNRLLKVTSRGGSFLLYYFSKNKTKENPFLENFNAILDIAKANGVVLSLALSLRSGCLYDQMDSLYLSEIQTNALLVKQALQKNVPVMVEGVGHTSISALPSLIKLIKKECHGVPLRTLGPPVMDIALGLDHISGVIGGALAGLYGADLLGVITRTEHLGIPSLKHVKEAVESFVIAAHAVNVARGIKSEFQRNFEMSLARRDRNWSKQWQLALFGELAKKLQKKVNDGINDTCSMCGELCSLKTVEYLINRSCDGTEHGKD